VSRSSADPFDELRRNAIFNDRHSQDAVIVQHFACTNPRLSGGSVRLPRLRECGGCPLHHRCEKSVSIVPLLQGGHTTHARLACLPWMRRQESMVLQCSSPLYRAAPVCNEYGARDSSGCLRTNANTDPSRPDPNPGRRVSPRGERLPSPFKMNRRQLKMKDVDGVT
jgi:hypothetical protein